MAIVPLYPRAFVRIFQTTKGLPHIHTKMFHAYTPPSVGHAYGQVERWDGVIQDADTVVEAEMTGQADLFTVDTTFNSMLFFTQAAANVQPVLQAAKLINIPGTIAIVAGVEYLAVQTTFNFLTMTGAKYREQFMENSSRNLYLKTEDYAALNADEQSLVDYDLGTTSVWAAQDGSQPAIWRSRTCTLNDKIRKERRMT